MKSFLLSLLSCVAIAYVGAFFEVWTLPRHGKMFTASDLAHKLVMRFGYKHNLEDMRNTMRQKNEEIFANKAR